MKNVLKTLGSFVDKTFGRLSIDEGAMLSTLCAAASIALGIAGVILLMRR